METFPLIMQNKMWIGVTPMSREIYFNVPQSYIDEAISQGKDRTVVIRDGSYVARSPSIWFTNLDHQKRHEKLPLYKKFIAGEFERYDNYNAININKTEDIPYDYNGVMGVPITFMDKYNPGQFEILGLDRYVEDNPKYGHRFTIGGKETYARILIRRKQS